LKKRASIVKTTNLDLTHIEVSSSFFSKVTTETK